MPDERQPRTKPWADYPVGTKAPALLGGHWVKAVGGWKWDAPGGGNYPRPGADNTNEVILPPTYTSNVGPKAFVSNTKPDA